MTDDDLTFTANDNHSGEVTLESLKAAMEKMRAIPKPRKAVVLAMDEYRGFFKAMTATLPPVFPYPMIDLGIPVKFYRDRGEQAEAFFDHINDGFDVYQIVR